MHTWQLQEAKAKLSELVKYAKIDGPQAISVHGNLEVVVLSIDSYKSLKKENFVDFMRKSPLVAQDIDLNRDKGKMRDIEL